MKTNLALLCLILLPLAVQATDFQAHLDNPDDRQIWQVPDGRMTIEFRPEVLDVFGVQVYQHGERIVDRQAVPISVRRSGDLSFLAPYGNFERFHEGRLELETGLEIRYLGRTLDLNRVSLVPSPFHGQPGLAMLDEEGRHILNLTHFHVLAVPLEQRLEIKNADVVPAPAFEQLLGFPDHSALFLGTAAFDLTVDIPQGADISQQAGGCTNPQWPQDGESADVALIAISQIQQMGGSSTTPEGAIKVTPSATLKNVGKADIPWVPKFGSISQYQHEPRDQHPFLLWAMYRIHDGRIRMLANSGAKHAWLTVNTNCPCSGGNILWPDCEDVYGTGINDNGSDLGPRSDIQASIALHKTCGSFFDPHCQGFQSNSSDSAFENRLVVHPDEFQLEGAEYFFDSWYVVQYDVDIWNTMGYRPVNPTPVSGGWGFSPGTFTNGPPISEWVPENNTDPMADHQVVVVPSATPGEPYPGNMPQGHLRLLVQVTEVDNDRYRYNYALQNFDFERGVESFTIPVPTGTQVFDTWFGGLADTQDWDVQVTDTAIIFEAPEGEALSWFTLYNFEIELDAPPATAELLLGLAEEAVQRSMAVETLVPAMEGGLLVIEPDDVDFGPLLVGDASDTETVTLTNKGTDTVEISSIDETDTPFSRAGDCPAVSFALEPQESCSLEFQFAPAVAGPVEQLLEVASDALNGTQTIRLVGDGKAPPASLSVVPGSLDFGTVFLGEQLTLEVMLENDGTVDVTISGLELPGTGFTVDATDCGGETFDLAPDASCTISITFEPEAAVAYTDEFVVQSNAESAPHSVNLTGSGITEELFWDRFEEMGMAPAWKRWAVLLKQR